MFLSEMLGYEIYQMHVGCQQNDANFFTRRRRRDSRTLGREACDKKFFNALSKVVACFSHKLRLR
jgi:hypothetical protein